MLIEHISIYCLWGLFSCLAGFSGLHTLQTYGCTLYCEWCRIMNEPSSSCSSSCSSSAFICLEKHSLHFYGVSVWNVLDHFGLVGLDAASSQYHRNIAEFVYTVFDELISCMACMSRPFTLCHHDCLVGLVVALKHSKVYFVSGCLKQEKVPLLWNTVKSILWVAVWNRRKCHCFKTQ